MSIIEKEYEEIIRVFKSDKNSFIQRKEQIKNTLITPVNWSSSYLDFYPYSSIINQLEPAKIYKKEKTPSIKNFYLKDELIFACNNENESWGSLFIDYNKKNKKSLLFVENNDEEMVLQELKVAYFKDNIYEKVLSYVNSEDDDEESLTIDLFEYDSNDNIQKIVRYGFFEEKINILPIREFDFSYNNNGVKIFANDEKHKNLLIYEGKTLG
ncbi:hypothetical protein V8245_04150 [Flavobacterium columnare]|uniref:hypothetical protein n=1 Tax=Flavobacterium columnare TaxID=996 RepID=UPI003C2B678B